MYVLCACFFLTGNVVKSYLEVDGSFADNTQAVDGDISSCSQVTASTNQAELSIQLKRQFRIIGLIIHVSNDGRSIRTFLLPSIFSKTPYERISFKGIPMRCLQFLVFGQGQ